MNRTQLFIPDIIATQTYGHQVSDLFYMFGYASKEEIEAVTDKPITVGEIPFVIRSIGIPSGQISLLPNNIPHMIGFGQEKVKSDQIHMHNLSLQEMLEIPNMLSDPDMIFRSNTKPNSSIIICREIEGRSNPVILAMKVEIQDSLSSKGIIVSGYEKDNSPKEFFSALYANGYCVYDGQRSDYFGHIKANTAAPNDNDIRTKEGIIAQYEANSKEVVAILHENRFRAEEINRNLSELGYHTLLPHGDSPKEFYSIISNCTAIACSKNTRSIFANRDTKHIKVGEATDFMPQPIFKNQMPPLSEVINQQKTLGRKSR